MKFIVCQLSRKEDGETQYYKTHEILPREEEKTGKIDEVWYAKKSSRESNSQKKWRAEQRMW